MGRKCRILARKQFIVESERDQAKEERAAAIKEAEVARAALHELKRWIVQNIYVCYCLFLIKCFKRHYDKSSTWVVGISEQNLRGRIGQTPATRVQLLSGRVQIGEPKVRQLHHANLLEEHHVLGLNISIERAHQQYLEISVDDV